MKILFTSVGRRVELIEEFKKAAQELGIDLQIIGVDLTSQIPAASFCDKFYPICKIQDGQYIPSLKKICLENKVDCLIPTIDTDLLVLSKNKDVFSEIGTKVLISDQDKIQICRDKSLTTAFFLSSNLKAPKAYTSRELFETEVSNQLVSYPAFIKPLDGSSSIDSHKVNNSEELVFYFDHISNAIVQPFIAGTEYTVDVFCDFEHKPIFITPRERLAVRGGEVLKTKIVQDDRIINEVLQIIQNFKPVGPITIQLIKEEKTGENYYIEINPRFGGGAPLSIKAGANSPKALLKLLNGEKIPFHEKAAQNGATYCRFDQSVLIND